VDEDDMLEVVAAWTGIPLSRMEQKESKKLLNLEAQLQSEVIGQNAATDVISKALRRSRADLKDPRRPIGSFMFLGPTGVGKTLLAKVLAEEMFGKQDAIIQIDMSEYMEKFAVSRLVGSPPGYVGYEEGGQLTEAVRRKPYSVVLFDEIEKAHPDVVQLLLQVLEEGRLTDSLGRKIDFRNTILIMTSNVGAEILQRNTSMGFGIEDNADNEYEKIREKIIDETKRVFKPEFLNRLNELVIFKSLGREDMMAIVELELRNVSNRLKDQDLNFEFTAAAKLFLIEKGYDEKYGARPLRRAIERHLEDSLAEAILGGEIKPGETIHVDVDGDQLSFVQDQHVSGAAGS
jgi:ATP-dependent Clp protease ATP-binding subunit ClpC